jgi:hypothetical protein
MGRTRTGSNTAADPAALSDDELLDKVKQMVACERRACAALVRSLIELDTRRLYLREGCSSLFTYCTQVLHLSEGSAYNRIEAARAARRFPQVLDALERGDLTLTSIRLLAPHLTEANHVELLEAARHRGKQDIQNLIAALNPRPAAATVIRPVAPLLTSVDVPATPNPSAAPGIPLTDAKTTIAEPASDGTPLSPERYRLHVTLTRQTHEKLRRAQALARHAVPNGDLGEILDRALTLLLQDLERRKYGRAAAPRPARAETSGNRRHIPAEVRRRVWDRDDGRCAFVGRVGRCRETTFLEFHHVRPFALGGAATADNIELRCRAHNQYEGRIVFGASP